MNIKLDFNNRELITDFLSKHSVIEASAGTGKTYTITKLINHIIKNDMADPEEILVVTFTEKASGELKSRITKELEDASKDSSLSDKERQRLKFAADNIDRFTINTIHGFCNSLIGEFSFEIGEQFQSAIVDDKAIIKNLFHRYMRKEVFADYGEDASVLLTITDFYYNPAGFEAGILSLTNKVYPLMLDGIDYLVLDGYQTGDTVKSLINEIYSYISLMKSFDISPSDISPDNVWVPKSGVRTSTKEQFTSFVSEIFNLVNNDKLSEIDKVNTLKNSSEQIKNFYNDKRLSLMNEGKAKDFIITAGKTAEIIVRINTVFKLNITKTLIKHIRQFKKEAGSISFNDMLTSVCSAINNNNDFLELIRSKYRFGLVDEFQDTDIIQWNIFKTIFIDGNSGRLIVIGDPKQAIYAFRNADVHTYLLAREEIREIGYFANLDTNFRSTVDIVENYNRIFSCGNYFINDEMNYENVNPNLDSKMLSLIPDENCKGMYLVNINNAANSGSAGVRRCFINFMADEIKSVIAGKYRFKRKSDDESGNVLPGDICVLVSARSDADYIQRIFKENGIESTFYKKAALYQSDEALQLLFLLNAVCESKDYSSLGKVLLSDFYSFEPSVLIGENSDEYFRKVSSLVIKLEKYALSQQWPLFFNYLFTETNLHYRMIKSDPLSSERKITNYQHIAENLEEYAHRNRLDIFSLRDYLKSLINQELESESETDLHRLETENSKVQIMTIHASKGLEFPVVFNYGALKGLSYRDDVYVYHSDKKLHIDIEKREENKEKYKIEKTEELRRLHYVALTRPVAALYIPIVTGAKKQANYAESFLKTSFIDSDGVADDFRDNEISVNACEYYTSAVSEKFSVSEIGSVEGKTEYSAEEGVLYNNFTAADFNRYFTIQSFTSIHRHESMNGNKTEFTQKKKIYENYEKDADDVSGLPGGATTGNMLHQMLEKLDYSEDIKPDNEVIKRNVRRYYGSLKEDILERYDELSAAVIKRVLNTHLKEAGIAIGGLKEEDRIHESEFYLKSGIHYINGLIDMVFRKDGKYYILDWKSNKLDYFSGELFNKAVEETYGMQFEIYQLAFIQYLQSVMGKSFDYDKHFGGVYYIYLRGLKENDESGIYYSKPDYEKYKKLSAAYEQLVESIVSG